jgi:hypothetical protein
MYAIKTIDILSRKCFTTKETTNSGKIKTSNEVFAVIFDWQLESPAESSAIWHHVEVAWV